MTPLTRNQIAWRAAQDLVDGSYVNLGMGMPVLAANYAPEGRDIMFQSENGIVGVGPVAEEDAVDLDFVDAGGQFVTLRRGASLVDSAQAFAMIRGGHIDVTLLGGFQISVTGDLANWDAQIPNKGPLVGGAMDLAVGAKSVWVAMAYVTRDGAPRLVETCSYPVTGVGVVDRIYTDLAFIECTRDGFLVREIIDGLSRDELRQRTAAPLEFAADCTVLAAPDLSS